MRLFTVFATTALFACLSLEAQSLAPSDSPANAHYVSTVSICPVAMRVRQGVGSRLSAVRDGRQIEMFAARLRLGLDDGHPNTTRQMVTATMVVHGLNGKERILPAGATGGSVEISRTFTVKLASEEEQGASGDLSLPGFTSASMVDLQSVTYSDGSTWKFSGPSACHVAPDFFMPVSGR